MYFYEYYIKKLLLYNNSWSKNEVMKFRICKTLKNRIKNKNWREKRVRIEEEEDGGLKVEGNLKCEIWITIPIGQIICWVNLGIICGLYYVVISRVNSKVKHLFI